MAEKIYVVMGSVGRWSEWTEWPVAAYTDEEEAKKHVELATEVSVKETANAEASVDASGWNYQIKSDYDKVMDMDHIGATYDIIEIELFVDMVQYKLEL